MKERRVYSTDGHINPVSYFYLTHSLLDAGFDSVSLTTDRYQRGSLLSAIVLYPVINLYSWINIRKERSKYRTIDESNIRYVKKMSSLDILLGRTIILSCKKQAA